MIELQAHRVARYFGSDALFHHISLTLQTGERVGLIGRNGTGKSTLLKILTGVESPDEGDVHLAKERTLGYLDQYALANYQDWTVFEVVRATQEKRFALLEAQTRLASALADPDLQHDSPRYQEILDQYDNTQVQIDACNAYAATSDIKMVLSAFHFSPDRYEQKVSTLSGGQQTRLALAKLLLEAPDILILDEPTNHLDIDTLAWLEDYLISRRTTLLVVSHDQYFLDKICTRLYELSQDHLEEYPGNYSYYLKEREARYQQQLKRYEKQQEEIHRLEDFVAKNIVRASTTKQAQSRRKLLERMERIERPKEDHRSMSLSFRTQRDSGKDVLKVTDMGIGYSQEAPLAQSINLDVKRQQAIAIVGPNGIGKTTLLKTLLGQVKPLTGEYRFGSHIDLGYYDQHLTALNHQLTVLEEVWQDHTTLPEVAIRTLLGSFLFSGDDVLKSIGQLSGGERARVALAKLSLEGYNTLLMDEPTNHLDLDSKEVLEEALSHYDGTLLFVSHDRYFINHIATAVLELSDDSSQLYLGDYDYYLAKKAEEEERAQALAELNTTSPTSPTPSKPTSQSSYEDQKAKQRRERDLYRQFEKVEEEIDRLEAEKSQLHQDMTAPEVFSDPEQLQTLSSQLEAIDSSIQRLTEEWEALGQQIESL